MIGERKEERGGLNEDGEERILKDFIKMIMDIIDIQGGVDSLHITKIKKAKE